MKPLFRIFGFGALACCLAIGCSKSEVKKQTIEGTVSYKGEPVRSGILRFVGTGGVFATAPIRTDGTFTITDVIPGEFQVGITAAPVSSSSSSDGKKSAAVAKAAPLPEKYRKPETSGLKYTIGTDTRKLDIELK